MAAKAKSSAPSGGRQAAYTARNRAAILKSAQEVLAEIGPEASIEQLSSHAQVSPTTIYKYFKSKEALFAEALDQMWREWVAWSYNYAAPASTLESVTDSARKLFFMNQTHPQLAQIVKNVLSNPHFLIEAVKGGGVITFKALAKSGQIEKRDFEERLVLWSYCLIGLLTSVYMTKELTPKEAEVAFGIGLSIWGISEARSKKLMARPLQLAPTQ